MYYSIILLSSSKISFIVIKYITCTDNEAITFIRNFIYSNTHQDRLTVPSALNLPALRVHLFLLCRVKMTDD